MTGATNTEDLGDLAEGDEISVSARDTPMEVTSVDEHDIGPPVTVEAENHHGRYRLRQHSDGSISLRAGGQLVSGDVTVEPVTEATGESE